MCIITASIAGIVTGVVSAVTAVAGTAMGIVSSMQQAKQQQAMYDYQAQVAKQNAEIAQRNADTERQTGIEEARLQRMKTLQMVGSQQAAMAANGMDITQGTSLDIIEDTAAMGELDALQIQTNYERKALAYEQQANNFQNEATMDIYARKNAYSAGRINALRSGLNGISNTIDVSSKWFGFGGNSNSNNGMKIKKGSVSGGIVGDNVTFM